MYVWFILLCKILKKYLGKNNFARKISWVKEKTCTFFADLVKVFAEHLGEYCGGIWESLGFRKG